MPRAGTHTLRPRRIQTRRNVSRIPGAPSTAAPRGMAHPAPADTLPFSRASRAGWKLRSPNPVVQGPADPNLGEHAVYHATWRGIADIAIWPLPLSDVQPESDRTWMIDEPIYAQLWNKRHLSLHCSSVLHYPRPVRTDLEMPELGIVRILGSADTLLQSQVRRGKKKWHQTIMSQQDAANVMAGVGGSAPEPRTILIS